MKYIRWTMKLNKNTPWHTIRKETGRKKIAIETIKRAMKFDIKMNKAGENKWERICWEQVRKREEEEWKRGMRSNEGSGKRETLERAGLSIRVWNEWLDKGEEEKG